MRNHTDSHDSMERLGIGYIGHNLSHKRFAVKIARLKVFTYVFLANSEDLFNRLVGEFEAQKNKVGHQTALAIVTEGGSRATFKTLILRYNEVHQIANSIEDIQNQVYHMLFCDVYRVFSDYQIDLYNEIAPLAGLQQRDDLGWKKNRNEAIGSINLSVLPRGGLKDFTVDQLRIKLVEIENIRHLLEHKDGVVDSQFLARCQTTNYKLGDLIDVKPVMLSETIHLCESLVESLNLSAFRQYSSLNPDYKA